MNAPDTGTIAVTLDAQQLEEYFAFLDDAHNIWPEERLAELIGQDLNSGEAFIWRAQQWRGGAS